MVHAILILALATAADDKEASEAIERFNAAYKNNSPTARSKRWEREGCSRRTTSSCSRYPPALMKADKSGSLPGKYSDRSHFVSGSV